MSKHIFLGQASDYTFGECFAHAFSFASKKDSQALTDYLANRYKIKPEQVILTKNGRSALALALKAVAPKDSKVGINGLTCYAVIEAIKAAGLEPVYIDINAETLHFDETTLKTALKNEPNLKTIIIQNTFGIPADIEALEKLAKTKKIKIIEDLAHCVGTKYADGREAGTVGEMTALSFGKEKVINAISGGALIINNPEYDTIAVPSISPKISDSLRARFYPFFGRIYRKLSYVKLNGAWMRFLLSTHQVERSADSKLELKVRPSHLEMKTALKKFKKLPKNPPHLREFVLVENRSKLLAKLRKAGYYLDGFWYDTPIIPSRYYKKAKFDVEKYPVAAEISQKIINLPTHYSQKKLEKAYKIIEEHQNGNN